MGRNYFLSHTHKTEGNQAALEKFKLRYDSAVLSSLQYVLALINTNTECNYYKSPGILAALYKADCVTLHVKPHAEKKIQLCNFFPKGIIAPIQRYHFQFENSELKYSCVPFGATVSSVHKGMHR